MKPNKDMAVKLQERQAETRDAEREQGNEGCVAHAVALMTIQPDLIARNNRESRAMTKVSRVCSSEKGQL